MIINEEKIQQLKKLGIKFPIVENNCIGCSTCCIIANEIFEMNDEGKACIKNIDSFDENIVNEAIGICPVGAIKWNN